MLSVFTPFLTPLVFPNNWLCHVAQQHSCVWKRFSHFIPQIATG